LIFNNYKVDITTTPTLPSAALKVFRSKFMQTNNIPIITGTTYNTLVGGYYGGLVEFNYILQVGMLTIFGSNV